MGGRKPIFKALRNELKRANLYTEDTKKADCILFNSHHNLKKFLSLEINLSIFDLFSHKKYAYTLQLPYHLYHFTPITIKNYLKLLNFQNVKIIHKNFDRDLLAPLNFLIRENPNKLFLKVIFKFATKRLIRKVIIRTIVNLFSLLGKTSRMTVIAEK